MATDEIPSDMLEIYQDVAEAWGMDWALLAAVGFKESTHNTNRAVDTENGAGALGPMQFIPAAWEHHGLYYGDKTGEKGKPPLKERLDPKHSVWSAAHKLTDQGVNTNPEKALVRYYGADVDGYVPTAMAKANQYRDGDFTAGTGGEVIMATVECPENTGISGQAPAYAVGDLSGQLHLEPCILDDPPFGPGNITPLTCAGHRAIVDNFRPRLDHGGNCKRSKNDGGQHFTGQACDYMTSKGGTFSSGDAQRLGDMITEYVMNNHSELGVRYIIWYQSIWHPNRTSCDGGRTSYSANVSNLSFGIWCGMNDRGSITENHYDHVHVSFID
ncbi:transglycosylase SLT domain-containing protein (plasmid) [Nocardiopsis exhalans]|uniref:Transglycosylase SLT domain-containing protein n=2 Tax=Nocardiopsis exhalans TaxID=163604 RepID=A0ABY5DGR0_9ACTN|nr:transglycosylase SLT domain-containing protein [Nocardiopsis exhalans]USY23536.1 transglycosylase SLT domain-containing protein [Nocardiopsis exhalans]